MQNIDFKKSNYYLQNADMLQNTIGFVSPFTIDTYVKETFEMKNDQITISGGNIDLLNKDHIVDETLICYKISRTDKLPIFKSEGRIWFNFTKWEIFEADNILRTIQGVPYISLLLLFIFAMFILSFSPFLAEVFKILNAIGLLVTILYFSFRFIKLFYDTIRSKAIDYNGVKVTYERMSDMMELSDGFIEMLKYLNTQYDIKKIALFNGEIYIKQDPEKLTLLGVLKEAFRRTEIDDESIEHKVSETIEYLTSLDFIKSQTNSQNA